MIYCAGELLEMPVNEPGSAKEESCYFLMARVCQWTRVTCPNVVFVVAIEEQ